MRALNIGILGPGECTPAEGETGYELGRLMAGKKATLVCGGLGGLMEAAAMGAQEHDGLTVGVLPGDQHESANSWIDLPLPTGLGPLRNMVLVQCCDAVIAVSGRYGTLSEIAFALRIGVPVIGLNTWSLHRNGKEDAGVIKAESVEEAAELAIRHAEEKRLSMF